MSPSNLFRRPCAAAVLVLIVALAASSAFGQTLTWSGSAGAWWDTSDTNWSTWSGTGGPWDATNGTASIADFNTAGATPVVNGTVYANGLQFDNTANIQSGTINLVTGTLTVPTITVNASGGTIGSIIAGSAGFATAGAGLLTLAGNNTYTGPTNINSGALALSGTIAGGSTIYVGNGTAGAGGALQLLQSGTNSNTLVLNGGTVSSTANAQNNEGSGGTITLSAGEVIHTFTATGSSSLVLPMAETAQVLVVGGGGGGGAASDRTGGGGGGGGVLYNSSDSLAASTYTVTVGSGGVGAVSGGAGATDGGASVFGSMTAYGGGFGADSNHLQAGTGNGTVGSGGGAYHNASSTLGVGTTGQGNSGGSGYDSQNGSKYFFAGGGGGPGAAGTSANSSTTGAGGNGAAYNISGATVYYGGGGGGGVQNNGSYAYSAASGGAGGGGAGGVGGGAGSTTAAAAGTNGLGGGGGGAGNSGNGAAGGSGVVVVSYAYVSGAPVVLSGAISVPVTSTLDTGSLAGLVVNSPMTGAGGINVTSSAGAGGVVSYAVAQGYTGGTTVNANATLQLQVSNALPYGANTGNVSVNGTLDLDGQATTNVNGLSGSGTITSTATGTPQLVVGNNAASSTFGGVIQNGSATVGLTMAGPGMLTLTGANSYSGGTTINQGTLQIGNGSVNGTIGTGTYSIASAGKLYLNYATASDANVNNITGGGTLELSAADNGCFTPGSIGFNSNFTGTLQIDKGQVWNSSGGATAVVVENGGQFVTWGGGSYNLTIAGTGCGAAGYGDAIRTNGSANFTGSVTLASNATVGADTGCTENFSGVISGAAGANLTIGTSLDNGQITFSGGSSNTYAGTTTAAYGTLILSKAGAVAVPGNLTMANNTTVTQYQPNQLASTSTVTVNATNGNWARLSLDGNNLTIGGITDAGGAVVQNGPPGVTAPANATLTLNLSTTNNNISGYLRNNDNGSNATTLGLTINGNGMLTLSGGNITYSGATNVSGGTLVFSGAVNNNSSIVMANGANLTFNATGSENFTQSITGAAGNVTFNVAGNTSPTGGGDPTNFSLQNTGAFTGTVVVNTGLVAPGADSAFGNAANVVQLNAASGASSGLVATSNVTLPSTRSIQLTTAGGNSVFRAYSGVTFEIDGAISGPGNLATTDGGTVKLVGDNTYTGNTDIGDADLDLVGGGQLGGGNYAGTISGGGGLYVNISGTQVLSGSNTYSGGTELYGGTLQVNAMSGIGTGYLGIKGGDFRYMGTGSETDTRTMWDNQLSGGTIEVVNSSAVLTLNPASGNINNNLTKAGAGALVLGGIGISGGNVTVNAGMLTLTAANAFGGGTTINGGTLSIANGGSASNTAITVNANGTLNLSQTNQGFGSRSNIAGNNITGSGMIDVNNAGSGISGGWIIANASNAINFSGTININSGVFGTDGSGGGGVIQGTATVNVASGGVFTNHASSGVTIGALNGAGDVTPAQAGGGTYNLTVGNGGGSGTFTGIIHGNNSTGGTDGSIEAGYLSLTKTGGGIELLTGANTYTGATSVNGGTLSISGAGVLGGGNYPASITNNAALVFNTSTNQTLAGAISGAGSLTQSGNNVLTLTGNNAGYNGPVSVSGGTLELANVAAAPAGSAVAVGPSAGLQLDAAGATLYSLSVANASTLVLPSSGTTGTALTNALTFVSSPSVTVKPVLGSVPSLGSTYNLITGGAAVSGTPAAITTDLSAYAPTRVTGTTAISGNNLVFTVVTGPANLVWNNAAGNSTWDLNTSTNFNNNGTNDVFQTFDSVTFDDTATPGTVTLSGDLQAGVVTVNNSTGNYTFAGTGAITGIASLVKSGSSALILTGNNSYTGGTTISGGTLQLGTGAANVSMGSGTYGVASGTALLLYSNIANTYSPNWANIAGGGTLAVNTAGSGTGTGDWGGISLSSGFTGTLQISGGRVYAPSAGAGLGGATTVVVQNGGQFGDWVGGTYSQNFILAGTGYGESGYGVAIRGGNTTLNGSVTLAAATTIGAGGGTGLQLNGTLYGGGYPLSIGDSSQTGTVTLNGSGASSLNAITINNGTLVIGASGNIAVASGGVNINQKTLNVYGTLTTSGGISAGGTGSALYVAGGGSLTAPSYYAAYVPSTFQINGTASLGNLDFAVAGNPTMTGAGLLNVASLTIDNYTGLTDNMTGGTMTVGSGGIIQGSKDFANNTFSAGATTIGATAPWSSGMAMTLNDATTGTTFDTAGGNITLSGALNGAGILHKAGPGTLYLSGANTYSGATSVNSGTLSIGAGGSTGSLSTSSVITDNATLAFNRSNTATQGTDFSDNPIAGSGALVQMGPGMLILNAANSYGGGTYVNGGVLRMGAANALPSGPGAGDLTVSAAGTFDLNGNTTNLDGLWGNGTVDNTSATPAVLVVGNNNVTSTFAGVIQNTGGASTLALTKTGTGAFTLGSTNFYGGTTTVQQGTLVLGAAGAVPGDIAVTGGTLDASQFAQGIGSLTMSPGGGLNLAAGNLLACTGTATLAGTLDILNFTSGTAELMSYGSLAPSSSFATVLGLTLTYKLAYNPGQLDIVAVPFTGLGTWGTGAGAATWSNPTNWTDANGNNGVPGDGTRTTPDTATFSGSGSTAITLDVNPSVAALSFSGANYVLSGSGTLTLQGSAGMATVSVTGGTQSIASAMQISGGSLVVNASGNGVLGISGNISDDNRQESLTLAGDGTGELILSGSDNTYGGGTTVEAGTLVVNNSDALPAGASLTVGAGGTFIFDPSVTGTTMAGASHSVSVAAVPEPGTLVLLAAGLLMGFGVWQRHG